VGRLSYAHILGHAGGGCHDELLSKVFVDNGSRSSISRYVLSAPGSAGSTAGGRRGTGDGGRSNGGWKMKGVREEKGREDASRG